MDIAASVIVVMGVSGCGKSTIGLALAARFECAFIEGDDLHAPESVARMRAGIALTDDDRWPWLAAIGTTAGAAARADGLVVIACSALRRSYRDRIRDHAGCTTSFVLLDPDMAELERRVAARRGHYMPASLLQSQVSLLEPPGPDELAARFAPDHGTPAMIDEITVWLRAATAATGVSPPG